MKYWLVLLLLGLSWTPGMAQDRMKIGLSMYDGWLPSPPPGKRAGERLQAQLKKAEADTLKERQDLERLRADLEKKGPLLKDEERRNLELRFSEAFGYSSANHGRPATGNTIKRARDDARYSQGSRRGR